MEGPALGALLWLLTRHEPGKEFYFRLGAGKPLGFGTVSMITDLGEVRASTGVSMREYYKTWLKENDHTIADRVAEPAWASVEELTALKGSAENSIDLHLRLVVLRVARGISGMPVHYPRVREDGDSGVAEPRATSYEWFVANERNGRWSLPSVHNENPGLPYLPPPR